MNAPRRNAAPMPDTATTNPNEWSHTVANANTVANATTVTTATTVTNPAGVEHRLDGWDISTAEREAWVPWGGDGRARARVLAVADGYHVVLVEAQPGYTGQAHEHLHTEFLYLLEGSVRTQGRTMTAGNAYAAGVGSAHTDFTTESGATFVLTFKL